MNFEETKNTSHRKPGGKLKWLGLLMIFAVIGYGVCARLASKIENPKKRYTGVMLSEKSDAIFRRSCFNCHSNETVYPWYSVLPWPGDMVKSHIFHGRKHMNFSVWDEASAEDRKSAIEASIEKISSGSMPLPDYLRLHPSAKVSAEDLEQIQSDAEGFDGELHTSKSEN